MALIDTQQTMDAYFRDLLNRGDYSRHYSDDVVAKVLAPGLSALTNSQMPWCDVAFDADLVANVFGDLARAPALHTGDVEVGKSANGHRP